MRARDVSNFNRTPGVFDENVEKGLCNGSCGNGVAYAHVASCSRCARQVFLVRNDDDNESTLESS